MTEQNISIPKDEVLSWLRKLMGGADLVGVTMSPDVKTVTYSLDTLAGVIQMVLPADAMTTLLYLGEMKDGTSEAS